MEVKILDFLTPEAIKINMEATAKRPALEELVKVLAAAGKITDEKKVLDILLEREELGSTGIGQGIAIPHGKSDAVKELSASFGISKAGLPFDSLDGEPVHIVFMLVAPEGSAGIHLKALARISGLLKDKYFLKALLAVQTREDVIRVIQEEERAKH